MFATVAVLCAAAGAGWLDSVPLLDPSVAGTVEVLGAASLLASWASRRRSWLTRTLPLLLATVTLGTAGLALTLRLTDTVTDDYPASFAVWVGLALAAIAGLPLLLRRGGRARRFAASLAVPLCVSGAILLIDDEYGVWPVMADLLGHHRRVSAADLNRMLREVAGGGVDGGHAAPGKGVLADLDVPALVSSFPHRHGNVYLPPAYFTPDRYRLPVLLMLSGTPGAPDEWLGAGRAVATADAFASTHHGWAPIMVFADQNGSETGDTECVDGPRGRAETYLTLDVSRFVSTALGVAPDPDRWGVAGFSEGGMCALGLVLTHPRVYRHFVDLGGEALPEVGPPGWTLKHLFGGSVAAMTAHDTWRLLASHRYPRVTGWLAAGASDVSKVAVNQSLAAPATAAGMTVHQMVIGGGHSWQFASQAFAAILPQLWPDLVGAG